jgi:ABC-type multidrug transport system fused ATPase/permease subunit
MSDQISSILNLQDSELANSIHKLSSDPAKLNSFIAKRKSDVYNSVTKEHSDNFQKVYGDYTRSSDGIKNTLYFHARNKDLDDLQEAEYSKIKNQADIIAFNNQSAKRQYEINEWTSNNKLDTLFFFQLLLIVLTIIGPLLYANKIGLIPSSVYYGISTLVGIAVLLTLLVRLQYNIKSRDTRFWNRRRFAKMGGPPTTVSCDSISSLVSEGQNTLHSLESEAKEFGSNVVSVVKQNVNDLSANLSTSNPPVSNGPAPVRQ